MKKERRLSYPIKIWLISLLTFLLCILPTLLRWQASVTLNWMALVVFTFFGMLYFVMRTR